ncbi:MAG: hypothetical protein QNJ38_01210 [Prochloraceae cyanobacterium]|nr:hypothetical protein [Prochloraceae cyanobacterium]
MTLRTAVKQQQFDVIFSTQNNKRVGKIYDRSTGREIGQVTSWNNGDYWVSSEFSRTDYYPTREEAIETIERDYLQWRGTPTELDIDADNRKVIKHLGKEIGKYWCLGDIWIAQTKWELGKQFYYFESGTEAIEAIEANYFGANK